VVGHRHPAEVHNRPAGGHRGLAGGHRRRVQGRKGLVGASSPSARVKHTRS